MSSPSYVPCDPVLAKSWRKAFALLMGLALSLLPVILPCAAANAETLAITVPSEPESLDPHQAEDDKAWTYIVPCYQRLTEFEDYTTRVIPSLALTWRVSPDGLKYTFILREDRTFSDGLPVDANAIRISFQRMMSKPRGQKRFPHLTGLQIIGPHTVRFILNKPWSGFPAALAHPIASVVSPGVLDRPEDYLNHRTLGSGRYTLEDWQRGKRIILSARKDIGAGLKIDRVEVSFQSDPFEPVRRLHAGAAHIAADMDPTAYLMLKTDPAAVTYSIPTFKSRLLAMNTSRPWISDRHARRAIAHAIDYRGLITQVKKGLAARGDEPFPLGGARFSKDDAWPSYSPSKVRVELTEAGKLLRPLVLAYDGGDDAKAEEAAFIADNLKRFGIDVEILEFTEGNTTAKANGKYDLYLMDLQAGLVESGLLLKSLMGAQTGADGANPAHYRNDEALRILDKADKESKLKRRGAMHARLLEILAEDRPFIFLFREKMLYGLSPEVRGLRINPLWPRVFPLASISLVKPETPVTKPPEELGPPDGFTEEDLLELETGKKGGATRPLSQ